MLKNKYQRMNKDDKKKLYKKYIKTNEGANTFRRLNRIFILGLLLLLYSIYLVIDIILNNNSIVYCIFSGLCLLISIIFIFSYHRLKVSTLNKFALSQK